MKLNDRDINLVLSGLRLISNDNDFSPDIKRRAKFLEDELGSRFTKGCEVSQLQSKTDTENH